MSKDDTKMLEVKEEALVVVNIIFSVKMACNSDFTLKIFNVICLSVCFQACAREKSKPLTRK